MSEYENKMNEIIVHRVLKRLENVERDYEKFTKLVVKNTELYVDVQIEEFKKRILFCYIVSMLMFLHVTFIVVFSWIKY